MASVRVDYKDGTYRKVEVDTSKPGWEQRVRNAAEKDAPDAGGVTNITPEGKANTPGKTTPTPTKPAPSKPAPALKPEPAQTQTAPAKPAPAPAAPAAKPTPDAPADSDLNDLVKKKEDEWNKKAKAEQEAKAKTDADAKSKADADAKAKADAETKSKNDKDYEDFIKKQSDKAASEKPTKTEPVKEPVKEPAKAEPSKTAPEKTEPKVEPKPEEPSGPSLWDRIKGAVSGGGSSSEKEPAKEVPSQAAPVKQEPSAARQEPTQAKPQAQAGTQSGTQSGKWDSLRKELGMSGSSGTAKPSSQQGGGEQPGNKPGSAIQGTTSNTPGTGKTDGPGKTSGPGKTDGPGKTNEPGKSDGPGKTPVQADPAQVKPGGRLPGDGYWKNLGDGFQKWVGPSGVDPQTGQYTQSGTIVRTPTWEKDDKWSKEHDPEALRKSIRDREAILNKMDPKELARLRQLAGVK